MKPHEPKQARAYTLTLSVLTTAPLKRLLDPDAYSISIYISPSDSEATVDVKTAKAQPIEPWDKEGGR